MIRLNVRPHLARVVAPGVHSNSGCDAGVDRARAAELGNRAHDRADHADLLRQPRTFLAEYEHRLSRERGCFQRSRSGEVVDPDDAQPELTDMGQEALDRRMVDYVLVPIRDHGPPPVPPSLADDVDRGSHEGVRIPNHGANVRVMLPVFDCHVEGMAAFIEVGNDRIVAPVAVSIDHIAPVSRGQQVRVEVWIVGPWSGVRANTYVSGGTIGSRHPAMVSALACPGAVAVARQGDSTVHVGVNFFPTAEAIDPIRLGEELEQRSFESMWLARTQSHPD